MSELAAGCTCGDCRTMLFVGGPADGMRMFVPGSIRTVQVPTLLGAGVAVAIYSRASKDGDPVMVCPGTWPLARE